MTTNHSSAPAPAVLRDPRSAYRTEPVPFQEQSPPGLTAEMHPTPDHGEESYVGVGRLTGRRALITGGDSGIGRAVAIAFAREGADVAISHLPDEAEDAASTIRLIEEAGRRGLDLPGDLRDDEVATGIVERTVQEFGGLDILVLNAAWQRDRDGVEEVDGGAEPGGVSRVFETNLRSLILTASAAVPHLPPGGSITITASIQAASPSPDLIDYAMTKAAQVAYVSAAARDLGEQGIRVNAVAPGPIWTPLIPATGWDAERLAGFGQDTPLGRAGQPAELAPAYVFLASDQASYVSGAVLAVTGGKPL